MNNVQKDTTSSQDIASVVAVSGQYVTVEDYVEAKHDIHIFKIGDFYRAIRYFILLQMIQTKSLPSLQMQPLL